MKQIFTSPNIAEVGLLRGLLESENVECFLRNEQLSMAIGRLPVTDCQAQLWILKDEDWQRAEEILARYQGGGESLESWVCPECGETNEGQFGACWKCGHFIDG